MHMDNKRNQSIDLFKFIFSICVIMIHTQLFKNNNIAYITITMGLARLAVPFFFITSGYYFYQKLDLQKNVKSYFIKNIKIFVIFEKLEVIFYTVPLLSIIQKYGIFVYLWRILSTGLGGAYWYITSLIFSLLILTPFWKRKSIAPTFIIGLLLYLVVFTNDSYGFFFENTMIQNISKMHTMIWTWPQAGLCSSLLYLSIGAYIYEKKPQVSYLPMKLFLSIICLICEALFLQTHGAYDGNCYIMLIVCVPLLFLWLLQHNTLSIQTDFLGQMSLYIYMLHPLIMNGFKYLLTLSSISLFVLTTIVTICLSYMIIIIQKGGFHGGKKSL